MNPNYDVLIQQVKMISEFIKNLDHSLPIQKRMSAVSQFTYNQRETVDKNFVYCGICSKGEEWVLSGNPIVKQKEIKQLFGETFKSDPWMRYFINFFEDKTIIELQLTHGRKETRWVEDLYVETIYI